jgi:hypothetical protein
MLLCVLSTLVTALVLTVLYQRRLKPAIIKQCLKDI